MTATLKSFSAAASRRAALEPLTDFELVRRVREQGDPASFELIMRRHNQRLYRLTRSLLRDPAEAEDSVQEAYVTAFDKLHSFNGPAGFASWLGRIALNIAYRRLGRRSRVVFLDDFRRDGRQDDDVADASPLDTLRTEDSTPEFSAELTELRARLTDAIDRLPPEFRTVFVLVHVEGCALREVADLLSIKEQTVKTRSHRARRRLQAELGAAFIDLVPSLHRFAGARCDRIVAAVLSRLSP